MTSAHDPLAKVTSDRGPPVPSSTEHESSDEDESALVY